MLVSIVRVAGREFWAKRKDKWHPRGLQPFCWLGHRTALYRHYWLQGGPCPLCGRGLSRRRSHKHLCSVEGGQGDYPDDLERGAIVVVPIHNPVAVLHKRRWGFIDNLDMNRVWPGDSGGAIPEVLADATFKGFVLESNYVLDLYTATSDCADVPHAIAPPEGWFKPREKSYAARTDESLVMARYLGVRFAKRTQAKEIKKYYAYYPGELHVVAPHHGTSNSCRAG